MRKRIDVNNYTWRETMRLRRCIRVAAVVSGVLGGFLLGVKFAPQCRDLKARLCGREFWRFDRYDLMVRMHKNWDEQLPAGVTYFLGDSHVQRLFVDNIVDGGVNVNYGIGSDTTWGLQARLNEYCSITNGSAFVIEIGCNDFIYHETTPSDVANRIYSIAKVLPKDSTIVICSLLPARFKGWDSVKESWMKTNEILESICRQNGFRYLDLWHFLVDEEHMLKQGYDSGDGVHLNVDGQRLLKRLISNELLQARKRIR